MSEKAIDKALRRLDSETSRCDYKGRAWISVIPAREILRELVASIYQDSEAIRIATEHEVLCRFGEDVVIELSDSDTIAHGPTLMDALQAAGLANNEEDL